MDTPLAPAERVRLLECWLPLVQALNQEFVWRWAAPALEQLVLVAAPSLTRISTLDDARALLYYYATTLNEDPQ